MISTIMMAKSIFHFSGQLCKMMVTCSCKSNNHRAKPSSYLLLIYYPVSVSTEKHGASQRNTSFCSLEPVKAKTTVTPTYPRRTTVFDGELLE